MRSKIEGPTTLSIRYDPRSPTRAFQLAIEETLRLVGHPTPISHASKYRKLLLSAYAESNAAKSSSQNANEKKALELGDGAETITQT